MSWRNFGNGPTVGMNNNLNHHPPPPPNHNPNNHNRPSDARRAALSNLDKSSSLILSNLCPIQRYYTMADRLLSAFDAARQAQHLDDAYVLGKRYAKFSLEALPQHDYYASSRPELARLRSENQKQARRVVEGLEQVVKAMDEEEVIRQAELARLRKIQEQERLVRLEKEKKEREKRIAQTAEEKLRRLKLTPRVPAGSEKSLISVKTGMEGANKNKGGTEGGSTESTSSSSSIDEAQQQDVDKNKKSKKKKGRSKSPLKKLSKKKDKLKDQDAKESSTAPVPDVKLSDITPVPPPPPSYSSLPTSSSAMQFQEEAMNNFSSNFRDALESGSEMQLHGHGGGVLPPPSYSDVAGMEFGGSPLTSVSTTTPPIKKTPADKPSPEDAPALIQDLKDIFISEYNQLKQQKKVQVLELNTYQGRNKSPAKDSTNGCTVISPLVVIHHLSTPSGGSISDGAIEDIIDHTAPPILSEVRRKLGLGASALIIPSDVHDCLVDKKLLKQEQFVGAVGGNILDAVHLGQLIQLLELGSAAEGAENKCQKNKSQTLGRTKKVGAALFFHEHVVSIVKLLRPNGEECWYDLVDSLPRGPRGNAIRTRCKGVAALEQTIRWYACTKFTESDEKYIDGNIWDDLLCDFDPRVFQAFVWEETV